MRRNYSSKTKHRKYASPALKKTLAEAYVPGYAAGGPKIFPYPSVGEVNFIEASKRPRAIVPYADLRVPESVEGYHMRKEEEVAKKEALLKLLKDSGLTIGGAGLGFGASALLTKNPWLRALGTGVGGIGGYLAANPKIVTDFMNRIKNNNKMASVRGKAMKKIASPTGLNRQWLLDNLARHSAQEFREKHYDDVVKSTTGLGGVTGAGIGGGLAYLIARKITENRLARAGITGAGALIGGAAGAGIGYKAAPAAVARVQQHILDQV